MRHLWTKEMNNGFSSVCMALSALSNGWISLPIFKFHSINVSHQICLLFVQLLLLLLSPLVKSKCFWRSICKGCPMRVCHKKTQKRGLWKWIQGTLKFINTVVLVTRCLTDRLALKPSFTKSCSTRRFSLILQVYCHLLIQEDWSSEPFSNCNCLLFPLKFLWIKRSGSVFWETLPSVGWTLRCPTVRLSSGFAVTTKPPHRVSSRVVHGCGYFLTT